MSERNPIARLRNLSSDIDRMFEDWTSFRRPFFARVTTPEPAPWFPKVDVFQRDNRLITRVDLPGMKKEDVAVEVIDGQLTLSGERKREIEEKKDQMFRSEREYGSFYRTVPLPEGVKTEDIRATFADGVLEVSMPLPARIKAEAQRIQIDEPQTPARTAA
ncbi:MAG TPA: Hsp20/alpha crystallin family protein [Vicinamibacterales bacterium]|nr:Hsp20/alpha crystallin family protein [Vicinamibacterales bacterium]